MAIHVIEKLLEVVTSVYGARDSITLTAPRTNLMFARVTVAGNIVGVGVYLGHAVTSGQAAWNLRKNGTALFSGASRPIVTSGNDSDTKTGLSFPVVIGDQLYLDLEEIPSGGVATPVTLLIFIDDGVTLVAGPGSATDNAIALFDGTTGKLLKDSGKGFSTDGTLGSNSDALIPTQKAVKTYANQILAAADAMRFLGVIDCSANPNYPAGDAGDTYRVSVAGKIGGSSGVKVEIGDQLLCLTDSSASGNQATVGSHWNITQSNIDGAVVGPASATDLAIVLFDGAGGKLIKDSAIVISTDGTLASNSDSKIPTEKAVATAIAAAGGGGGGGGAGGFTPVAWTTLNLLTLTGNTLERTSAPFSSSFRGIALANTAIADYATLRYVVGFTPASSNLRGFGLNASATVISGGDNTFGLNADYFVFTDSAGTNIFYNGSNVASFTCVRGDVLELKIIEDDHGQRKVHFCKNGALVYTFATAVTGNVYPMAMVYQLNDTMGPLYLELGPPAANVPVPAASSQVEAEAGTENTKYATSLRVAQAIIALAGSLTVADLWKDSHTVTAPPTSGLTTVNTPTVTRVNNVLQVDNTGSSQTFGIAKAPPSTSAFTFIVGYLGTGFVSSGGVFPAVGLGFRDSVGNNIGIMQTASSDVVRFNFYPSHTSTGPNFQSTTIDSSGVYSPHYGEHYFKMVRASGTMTYSYSRDGRNWRTLGTDTNTTFSGTWDQVGIFFRPGGALMGMNIFHWSLV